MSMDAVAAFVLVDVLLVLTPGADWAYVMGAGLRGRALPPAVAGLVGGYLLHTVLVVAGLAVLVATTPALLAVLTVLGAGYLIWLGIDTVRRPPVIVSADTGPPSRRWAVGIRGAAVSGLNPKGLLLYLALLPQFVDPAALLPVPAQTAVLGGLHMVNCALVYTAVGLAARRLLRSRPRAARAVTRTSGAAMLVIATGLLVEPLLH